MNTVAISTDNYSSRWIISFALSEVSPSWPLVHLLNISNAAFGWSIGTIWPALWTCCTSVGYISRLPCISIISKSRKYLEETERSMTFQNSGFFTIYTELHFFWWYKLLLARPFHGLNPSWIPCTNFNKQTNEFPVNIVLEKPNLTVLKLYQANCI